MKSLVIMCLSMMKTVIMDIKSMRHSGTVLTLFTSKWLLKINLIKSISKYGIDQLYQFINDNIVLEDLS